MVIPSSSVDILRKVSPTPPEGISLAAGWEEALAMVTTLYAEQTT